MEEITTDKLQIAYEGPALTQGRMPMLALSSGLRGQALLIERVKTILYGDSFSIQVEVDHEFDQGSLVVPVHILTDLVKPVEDLLSSKGSAALATLLTILGFLGLNPANLYAMFRRLKGHRIERVEDLPSNLKIDLSIDLLIRTYNDPEVQAQLRATVDPLRRAGIDTFQTRRQGTIIESVSKADLTAADDAELADFTQDEEIDLAIEKAAWRRTLAWHFSDGRTSFDAKIDDDEFWKRIDAGEPFAGGDRLRVHLQTTARRLPNGRLKIERRIPTVIGVEHVRGRQWNLPFEDQSNG